MVNHMQVPEGQRKEHAFYKEVKKDGRAIVTKEPMAFNWLSPSQERSLSFSHWPLLPS